MEDVFVSFIFVYAIAGALAVVWVIYKTIQTNRQFKYNDNPYSRTCRKCGALQHMYHHHGEPGDTWWQEMYPIGNDPNCKCHGYAQNRD